MPRKKKLGQSPARAPSGGPARGGIGNNTGSHSTPSFDSTMAANSVPSVTLQEQIVQNMQEMFANVDPDVIYIVLSECDFKVENAMDSLLELSTSVEPPLSGSPLVSGFEHTAAVLLSSKQSTQSKLHLGPSEPFLSSAKPNLLTEELDLLVDEELDLQAAQQDLVPVNEQPAVDLTTSSVHTPDGLQQDGPEVVQSILISQQCGSAAEKDLPQKWEAKMPGCQHSILSFQHLTTEVPKEDFSALGCATSSSSTSDNTATVQPAGHQGRAGSHLDMTVKWNLDSPVFTPSQQAFFITPVVDTHCSPPWVNRAPVNPKQTPSIQNSWALPAPQPASGSKRLGLEGKVLVLLRGAPGSGKSTLARAMKKHNPAAVILSTDDFFIHKGQYQFNPNILGEAHEWNHDRAKEAFRRGAHPIIIDNTNMQGWEMKPYVAQALNHNYKILFQEPDTWWKNKPRELERRSRHKVPVERIRRMLDNYERSVTIQSIMGSALPAREQRLPVENTNAVIVLSDKPSPDLVGDSEQSKGSKSSHPRQTLPVIPSIGLKEDSLQTNELVDQTELLNQDYVDSEVDVLLPNKLGASLQIPDCLKGSVMSEGCEVPVAFCDSIEQRVRRERSSRKSEFEKKDDHCLIDDTNQSEKSGGETGDVGEAEKEETTKSLNYEGDLPTERTLEHRVVRKRERQKEDIQKEESKNQDVGMLVQSGPDITQFQKLLELIQSGEDYSRSTSSSCPSVEVNPEVYTSSINPPASGVEWADCVMDLDAIEVNRDKDKVDCLTGNLSVLKLDSNEAVPLSNRTVITGLVGEAETCSIVGENERVSGIACQIHTNMIKEGLTDAFGFGENCSIAGVVCERSHKTSLGGMGLNPLHRSGKQCKLAPTFPQNSLDPLLEPLRHLDTERSVYHENPTNDTHSDEKLHSPQIQGGRVTQTEPQGFALLWRLNRQDTSDKIDDAISSFSNGFKVIGASSLRFVPDSSSRVHFSDQAEVPYRVVHEKGMQVEENDFGSFQDRLESLRILSRHFKLVTFDTLEDLYDKCHQDLDWTTNLLLDSGEKFFKEEEHVEPEFVRDTHDQKSVLKSDGANAQHKILTVDSTGEGPAKVVDMVDSTTGISESSDLGLCSGVEQLQLREKQDLDAQLCSHSRLSQEEGGQEQKPESVDVLLRPGFDHDALIENSGFETDVDIKSMDEIHRLLQAELNDLETAEKQKSEKHHTEDKRSGHVDIRSVEMQLPTEVALQLTELFGPIGVDADTCSLDDYIVQLDLNLAKLLHQKWKDTIQERQRHAALSFHLLQDDLSHDLMLNTPRQPVSLREIIKQEQALQWNVEKTRQDRSDLDRRDGATLLKEDQLFAKFPTIDRHFLQDIFRDHNYSLAQTEMFLHTLLDDGPAKTVVARVTPRSNNQRATSKEREKIPLASKVIEYQDTEEPQYEDFRAEARLQKRRQIESFSKAAEAFKQGRKEVASFYAQQGHLHGHSMREANHRAAIQIFEKVNSTLLPQNILDLHGLHVEEALEYLEKVLLDKTKEYEQGLCRPQLSVITGKGNHSQGGVARIRPAVVDYLNNRHYRFTEPNPGLVLVSLK